MKHHYKHSIGMGQTLRSHTSNYYQILADEGETTPFSRNLYGVRKDSYRAPWPPGGNPCDREDSKPVNCLASFEYLQGQSSSVYNQNADHALKINVQTLKIGFKVQRLKNTTDPGAPQTSIRCDGSHRKPD